jgi:hypothetical protein
MPFREMSLFGVRTIQDTYIHSVRKYSASFVEAAATCTGHRALKGYLSITP